MMVMSVLSETRLGLVACVRVCSRPTLLAWLDVSQREKSILIL